MICWKAWVSKARDRLGRLLRADNEKEVKMSDFAGMEDLMQDFLLESTELLSDVDNKLCELEKRPNDKALLNDIFRGFHTIKGGAGFLNVSAMVTICHRTENLFDKLRNGELPLSSELMDVILDA